MGTDRSVNGRAFKRNLVYYIYPLRGSVWRWNIEQIRQYLAHFNGIRTFVIAQDGNTDSAEDVSRLLDAQVNLMCVENDSTLREARWFLRALGHAASLDHRESTFYAHAKGVTHSALLEPVVAWARAMYILNLGCVQLIDHLLGRWSAVGAFKHVMPHHGSSWHYSGTFFWVKHSALFSRRWDEISPDLYGVEAYPGRHIPLGESYNLTDNRPYGDLYAKPLPAQWCEDWLEDLVGKERPV
jgi:hypothetical protein